MVARASYQRSHDRGSSFARWLGADDAYNAKFDYLMHNAPVFGQFANAVDAVRDANAYVMDRVGGWDKVYRTNVLAKNYNMSGLYGGVGYISKNLADFYL